MLANPGGGIGGLMIEETPLELASLDGRLRALLGDPQSSLRQVVIQAGSSLRYDALMSVVDRCARQKLASGKRLEKLVGPGARKPFAVPLFTPEQTMLKRKETADV